MIDSILYAINLLGEDHVALGSDWDGAVCRNVHKYIHVYIFIFISLQLTPRLMIPALSPLPRLDPTWQVKPPLGLNAGNISAITHGLLERGIEERIIEKVMGLNALDLFSRVLPD